MAQTQRGGWRRSVGGVAIALLPLAVGGLLVQTHLTRGAEARQLAEGMLGGYIDGSNGFQEMRDFLERRRGTDLRGVRVVDRSGSLKNRYPRDFEPSGWRVTAPIQGKDGVVRDVVELSHDVLPPLGGASLSWGLGYGLLLALLKALQEREARREAEAARQASEAQLALRDREEELKRLGDVWSTFHSQMTDDASQLTNHLQALNGFISQIDISLKDAVHDLYKAPLLGTGDLGDGGHGSLADVKSFRRGLEDQSIEVSREDMATFVRNVDETMEAIKWVVDSLPEYANRETQPVDPVAELGALLEHLPPALRDPDDGLVIEADVRVAQPAIMFNPVHFRSVVKNSLYNAVAAIRRARRQQPDREGRVTLRFREEPNRLGLVVEDTGDGLSEAALAQLYRGRVEQPTRRRRGGKGSLIVTAYLGFHGASSELANRPEGGARVTFWFTKAPAQAMASAPATTSPTC